VSEFERELFESSVFRPIRLSMEIDSLAKLKERAEKARSDDEIMSLIRNLITISQTGDVQRIEDNLELQIMLDSIFGVSLIGELFFERVPRREGIPEHLVERYFDYLQSKSPVFFSFSKANFHLHLFYCTGDEDDLIEAIRFFKQSKESGNITASILYNRLQLAVLKERRQKGISMTYFLGRVGLFLSMIPAFLDSVEKITVNRWWRYSEIERFMPERVKALDAAIGTQKVRWE